MAKRRSKASGNPGRAYRATNQAIKAVAIARSYLNEEGIDIVCVPSFIDVAIDDEERTAIRMVIERR